MKSLKTVLMYIILAVCAASASAQLSQITASHIVGADGKPLASGVIDFLPVTAAGQPIQPRLGGGGVLLYRKAECKIVSGAITTASDGSVCTLADTALTNQAHFCYKATVKDTTATPSALLPVIPCIQPSGTTWNLDTQYVPAAVPTQVVSTGPTGATGPAGPSGVGADPLCNTDGKGTLSCAKVAASSMSASGIATTPSTAPICPNGPGGAFTTTGCVAGSTFDATAPGPIGTKTPDTGSFTKILASYYASKGDGPTEISVIPTCIVSGCSGGVGTLASISDAVTGKTQVQVTDAKSTSDCGTGGGAVTHWCYCTAAANGVCSAWATATQSGGSGGVTSLNSLFGVLSLNGGAGITVTPSGSTITIALNNGSVTQKNCLSVACAGGSTYASGVIYTNTSGVAVIEEVTMVGPQNDNTGRAYEISSTINGIAGPINGITNWSYGHASVSFVVPSGATFYVSVAQTQGGTVTPSPSIYSWLESPFFSSGGSTSSSAYDTAGAASAALASAEDYSANASNISSGTLDHARLPALLSADIPNNAANTTGTAAGLSSNIAESQVTNLASDLASKADSSAIPTIASLGAVPTATTVNGHPLSSNVTLSAADLTTGILPMSAVPAQYKNWSCQPGIGDGLNAIPAGTYVQRTCFNTSVVAWTITGIKCYADSGASTVAVADSSANNLLSTTTLTCSSTPASGTQSSTYTTIAANASITFTFIADGTSKQATFIVSGVY